MTFAFSNCRFCLLKEKLKQFQERLVEERKKRLEERTKQRKEDRRSTFYRQKEEDAQRVHEEQLKKGDKNDDTHPAKEWSVTPIAWHSV